MKQKETAAARWAKQKVGHILGFREATDTPSFPPHTHTHIQYYLNVVDEVEEKRSGLRRECLCLMQKHIELQLQRLQETSRRLHRRLRRRQNRERVCLTWEYISVCEKSSLW